MHSMTAIEITAYGEPQVLQPVTCPIPEPQPDEVLIRVKAAGVARADTLQRQGRYPPPPGASAIPGMDVAGIIEKADSAGRFKAGQRVCAILTGGGYADYCVAPVQQVLPTPENWSDSEAAFLPENIFTAYDNLLTRAALKAGEIVLIHGGTSGLGSLAVMLARAVGARAIATAGSALKCEACLSFGAELAINYRDTDFVGSIAKYTQGRGVDVVLDMVGGAYLARNLEVLATEGRIMTVATQGGTTGDLDLAKLMKKRARVLGSTMRTRTPIQKGEIAQRLEQEIWPLLPAKNLIWPVIDTTFPLAQAWRAHQRMEGGEHIGKIVLLP